MTKSNNCRAFTLVELLLVVSVSAVLAVVAILSFRAIKLETATREAEENAKCLYISAQNRLMLLRNSGRWDELTQEVTQGGSPDGLTTLGVHKGSQPSDFDYWLGISGLDAGAPDYVFGPGGNFYAVGNSDPQEKKLIRQYLLPGGSVSGELIDKGWLCIEYNADTCTVYSAIFAATDEPLDYGEIAAYLDDCGRPGESVSPDEARRNRQRYAKNGKEIILGYYGGGIRSDIETAELEAPELAADNGEDLALVIGNVNRYDTELRLDMKGASSGASCALYLDREAGCFTDGVHSFETDLFIRDRSGTTFETGYLRELEGVQVRFILDSRTRQYTLAGGQPRDRRFAVFSDYGFVPGEDLIITVTVESAGTYLALPKSSSLTVNSLFYMVNGGGTHLACMRHLMNLSPSASGLAAGHSQTKVSLAGDISFSGRYEDPAVTSRDYRAFEEVGSPYGEYGGFEPIEIPVTLTFYGNRKKIYDLEIRPGEGNCIGLFGSVGILSVRNLGLVTLQAAGDKCEIVSAPDTVCIGAFAGSASQLTLSGCYSTLCIDADCTGDGLTYCIGGLVGKCSGRLNIDNCYCSGRTSGGVYDVRDGNIRFVLSENADVHAGGLVGYAGGLGTAIEMLVRNSYSNQSIRQVSRDRNSSGEVFLGGIAGTVAGEFRSFLINENSYHAAPLITELLADGTLKASAYRALRVGGLVGQVLYDRNNRVPAGLKGSCADCFLDHCGLPSSDTAHRTAGGNTVSLAQLKQFASAALAAGSCLPYDSVLAGGAYPFPDVTGLGHHYGDWQGSLPKCRIYVGPGRGVTSVSGTDWTPEGERIFREYDYGTQVPLDDIVPSYTRGYSGMRITKDTGSSLSVTGLPVTCGIRDMELLYNASVLAPPQLSMTGAGTYNFHYDSAVLRASCTGQYPDDGSISVHYEISYNDPTPYQLTKVRSADCNLTAAGLSPDGYFLGDYTVPNEEYTGDRYYGIRAYAYDGYLKSDVSTKIGVVVTYVKLRQKIVFISGEGWFYE